jgi:hypothetical protein
MAPDRSDVQPMVIALFTLIGSMDRAARQSAGASALSLLQVVASRDAIRPSEIADLQHVHPSLVTRPAWTGLPRSWPTGSPRKCGP